MALSRLFGKSKKEPSSPSGSHHSPDLSEREDDNFTVIETKPNNPVDPPPSASVNNLPYQLPQGGVGGGAKHAPHLEKQLSHPLDGVVFNLSPKLATDSELDHMTMTVDSVMNRLKGMEWAAFEYNFSLEQSVLSSDLSVASVKLD